MNGGECRSPISTATEVLNSLQEGLCWKWRYFSRIHALHLILELSFHFYDLGKHTYWNHLHFFKDVKGLLKTQRTAVGIRKW
jgi:hypothetical protein